MARRTRAEMQETRAALLATARKVFSERGYAETSMDDLTAQAGLTRGALYHHFGDKKGLLAAVVEQIDAEMDARLQAISDTAASAWEGFATRCRAYLEMALETDIQRLVLRDAKAVLGGVTPEAQRQCVESLRRLLEQLMAQGVVAQADAQFSARQRSPDRLGDLPQKSGPGLEIATVRGLCGRFYGFGQVAFDCVGAALCRERA
ncbi:TetR/AcrR family transcriptional regulator, partial [Pseudomonas farsensis]